MMSKIKIVITGGPSGGKTTLIEALRKEMGSTVAIVPEAASILYRGGFPRIKNSNGQVHAQKAIYSVQKELEELVADQSSESTLLICDRGSLDSVAYWPRSKGHLFKTLKTNKKKELKRYDWVIHLDTAEESFYDTTNPVRTETFKEALRLNKKIRSAWNGHSRRLIVSQNADFLSKMTLSLSIIRAILEGHTWKKIKSELLD